MPHRVLCIEEDDAFRKRVKALLEEEGFAVDLTESGLEGIARALTLTPDLVLADVHLPDIEGYDLAARLKREKALAKVPFLAVGDSPEEHDVALAAGADGFISRRLEDSLRDEVRAFLAGKRERLPEEGERAGLRALSGSMAAHRGARPAAQRVHAQPRARALDPAHAARGLPPHLGVGEARRPAAAAAADRGVDDPVGDAAHPRRGQPRRLREPRGGRGAAHPR